MSTTAAGVLTRGTQIKGTNRPVLIVAKDSNFRAEVARGLSRAGESVIEAADGAEAIAAAAARPAAVVMDVDLPDAHGFEVCRELRDLHGDDLPVIIVSDGSVTSHDCVAALLIGADDYLAKPVDSDELLARLRRLLARSRASSGRPSSEAPQAGLSAREVEVLRLFAGGRVAAAIAEQLVISEKTVATHLQHVMAKLGVHTRAQAVAEAYRLGLAQVGLDGLAVVATSADSDPKTEELTPPIP